MLEAVARSGAAHVLLSARWAAYGAELYLYDAQMRPTSPADSKIVFERRFNETIARLRDLGVEIWLVRQVPAQLFDVPQQLARAEWLGASPPPGKPTSAYIERQAFVDDRFEEVMGPGVHVIDPAAMLCDEALCRTQADGRSVYKDAGHLSVYGALWIRPIFDPLVASLAQADDSLDQADVD